MQPFEHDNFDGHEHIAYINDDRSGLQAIIAIHSTALGPAAGGCRMLPYKTTEAALYDVLRLSKGMSYKNAIANLPLGGGKAVIIGDPKIQKTPERLRAFGAAVEKLHGSYWTAEDMNITTKDLDIISSATSYAAGLEAGIAASGNPSPITAEGVYQGIKIAAGVKFGSESLENTTIAVQGIGSVGYTLCEKLHREKAHLIVADTKKEALLRAQECFNAQIVAPTEIIAVKADIFAPCAQGAILNPQSIKNMKANIVAGAANNQLSTPDCGALLTDREILYIPDYVINGGGIINVASEILKISEPGWVSDKLSQLMATLKEIITCATEEGVPTHIIADSIAKQRLLTPQ